MPRFVSRLLVAFLALLAAACGEPEDPTGPTPPESPEVDSVTLSALAVDFVSLGETRQLSATVLDAAGDTVEAQEVLWVTLDTAVATVSASGLLTAVANGSTEVRATAGEITVAAAVTVAQVAAAITASVDTLVLSGPGQMEQLTARVEDAGGSEVEGAGVSWSIDDAGVATIDGLGNVSAVASGTTTAHASTGGGSVILMADVVVVVASIRMAVDDFCGDFPSDAAPTFASGAFEGAVRSKLGIDPSDPMTCAMLATIDSMRVSSSGGDVVTSLRGAQNLVGTDTLVISGHAFSDLAPLGDLPELSYLVLADNDIGDLGLAELSTLTTLRHLDVGANPITGLGPLSGLTDLESLFITSTDVVSLAPLSGLPALVELGIGGTEVSDLAPIAGLKGLRLLIAGSANISDVGPLSGLTGLRTLRLDGNTISDLSPLSGLTGLDELSLTGNPITDVGPLSGLTAVRVLELLGLADAFHDVSALQSMTGLEQVNLSSNELLSDIQALIDNDGLGAGDEVVLTLTAVPCTSVEALTAKGVDVTSGCPG